MTSEGDAEYLSDGITDHLINNLSQLRGLRVVPRSTVFRYKGKVVDPQEAGRALNVRAVLAGRVIQRGDTLEIGVELVDVVGQTQLWGQQYSRKLTDILAIQTDLAREISNRLHLELSGEEQSRLVRNYTENTEAYHLYLKGLYHRQRTTEEGFNESIKYFQQAVQLDPTYPLAYAGLADSYASLGYLNILPPRDVWPKAKAAATTALKLDDTLAEAHAALGAPLLFYDWDWARARQEFDRAVELNPKYAITHHWYAHYWSMIGNAEEALKESRLAVQLEPLDLMLNGHFLFYLTGPNNVEEFAEHSRKLREFEPDFWAIHTTNGMSLAGREMYEDAILELVKGAESSGRMPLALYALLGGYAMSGKRSDVERIEAELMKKKYLSPGFLANIYMRLPDSFREKTKIMSLLEKAYQERDTQLLNLRRWPEPWKSDPEFDNLVQRVGLPE
jgi:TolB-like protein